MPCYHPLKAYRCVDGTVVFNELRRYDISSTLSLPCGQCVGCRLERSRQWAIRCMHEASLWDRNSFVTLTYSDEHLPADRSLRYDDFQKFMKRLRKRFKGHQAVARSEGVDITPIDTRLQYPIRFYMCGEYGEQFGRPHFHACLFNFDFEDKSHWMTTKSGSRIYRSKALEELWPFGFSSIGSVNFQSAAYVARYVMKKVNGDLAESHYRFVDAETGEVTQRTPEFNHMSLKPGIASDWFDRFHSDVYPSDSVVVNGKEVKPPKYYDRKFMREYPLEWDAIEYKRQLEARSRADDNVPARLAVKEAVAMARLSRLHRSLS